MERSTQSNDLSDTSCIHEKNKNIYFSGCFSRLDQDRVDSIDSDQSVTSSETNSNEMTLLIILCTAHNKQPNSRYDAEPRFCEQGGFSVFYIKYAEETPDGRVGETSSKRVGGG